MKKYQIKGITVYQYIFEFLNSNMYLIVKGEEAIIIDPHKNEDALNHLLSRNVKKVWVILTHEHTDHTSGIYYFQESFKCHIVCQEECAKYIGDSKSVRPLLIYFTLDEQDRKNGTNLLSKFKKEYVCKTYNADIIFKHNLSLSICGYNISIKHIPGHSKGSCLIIIDNNIAFSGDSLMDAYPIITRFPGSDHKKYVEFTIPILESLDKDTFVFPGHGYGFELSKLFFDNKLKLYYL